METNMYKKIFTAGVAALLTAGLASCSPQSGQKDTLAEDSPTGSLSSQIEDLKVRDVSVSVENIVIPEGWKLQEVKPERGETEVIPSKFPNYSYANTDGTCFLNIGIVPMLLDETSGSTLTEAFVNYKALENSMIASQMLPEAEPSDSLEQEEPETESSEPYEIVEEAYTFGKGETAIPAISFKTLTYHEGETSSVWNTVRVFNEPVTMEEIELPEEQAGMIFYTSVHSTGSCDIGSGESISEEDYRSFVESVKVTFKEVE